MTKFCKDCANSTTSGANNIALYKCNRPTGPNPVDGKPGFMNETCLDERDRTGSCKPEGFYFIAKPHKK